MKIYTLLIIIGTLLMIGIIVFLGFMVEPQDDFKCLETKAEDYCLSKGMIYEEGSVWEECVLPFDKDGFRCMDDSVSIKYDFSEESLKECKKK